jgi:HlyD family secretion protein
MKRFLFIIAVSILFSCSGNKKASDAYGNFEATEVNVSSEVNGKILGMNVNEGQLIDSGIISVTIDSSDWILKRDQLNAQKSVISSKYSNISAQVEVQQQQLINLNIEKNRLDKLLKDGAATTKQLDDIKASLNVIEKQINSIQAQGVSIPSELESINKQILQIELTIRRCSIRNPIKGIVLNKFAEQSEIAMPGKALYKIADMDNMYIRVYVSETQLSEIKTGQKVEVLIDKGKKEFKKYEGTISWISSSAEFTPKIIQTKEERVNLVYAVKVLVKNDGYLKIGMPGEVNFMK